MARSVAVFVLAMLLPAWPVAARLFAMPLDEPTPHLTIRPATLEISSNDNGILHDAVLAPDAQSIYVVHADVVVNIWAMAVYYWPWILMVITGALFLWTLARSARVWWQYRGIERGVEICRGCRYQLTGSVASTCPECGVELSPHNRVFVQGPSWRMLVPVVVSLALLVTAPLLIWAGVPRYGSVSHWFTWDSAWLADQLWAWDRDYLDRRTEFAVPVYLFEQRSIVTGDVIRCLDCQRKPRSVHSGYRLPRMGNAGMSTWGGGPRTRFVLCADENLLGFVSQLTPGEDRQVRIFELSHGREIETRVIPVPRDDDGTQLRLGLDGVLYFGDAVHFLIGYAADRGHPFFFDIEPAGLGRFAFREARYGVGQAEPRYTYHFVAAVGVPRDVGSETDLLVKDTRSNAWIARCDIQHDWSRWLNVSADGSCVLVVHESGRKLQLYDLSDVVAR